MLLKLLNNLVCGVWPKIEAGISGQGAQEQISLFLTYKAGATGDEDAQRPLDSSPGITLALTRRLSDKRGQGTPAHPESGVSQAPGPSRRGPPRS